jgi:hypothetical protein
MPIAPPPTADELTPGMTMVPDELAVEDVIELESVELRV